MPSKFVDTLQINVRWLSSSTPTWLQQCWLKCQCYRQVSSVVMSGCWPTSARGSFHPFLDLCRKLFGRTHEKDKLFMNGRWSFHKEITLALKKRKCSECYLLKKSGVTHRRLFLLLQQSPLGTNRLSASTCHQEFTSFLEISYSVNGCHDLSDTQYVASPVMYVLVVVSTVGWV